MAEIVGTIINAKNFLSQTEVRLSVKQNDPQEHTIQLYEDRTYSIPAFQREIRWDENNLKMLLSDLARGTKFLGNVILTVRSDKTCEIIDGQQRTTVLMLIVTSIKKKYGTQIDIPELCPLHNESFMGFQALMEAGFDGDEMTIEDWISAVDTDDYNQFPRIMKLWDTICSSELLSDRHKAQGLLDNLCRSEFNIIASYSDDVNTSIQYFLDVNLKGIRLDTEDIFKGYLFSQDGRPETRALWQKNKRDAMNLNSTVLDSKGKRYPLMKLYEHFFYCDLYLSRDGTCEYASLKFGENFCLTAGFDSGNTKFYEGSHLIEAVRDRNYLQSVLSRLNDCIGVMTDVIENEGPSTSFKGRFKTERDGRRIDSTHIQNCHSMLKKILMEKEIIPKILALKYILTYLDDKPHEKGEYKSIYSIFCASVLFTIFANKKESDTFYSMVRQTNWTRQLNEWLYDYVSSQALTRGKVLAAYRYSEGSDEPEQMRCKSLAAIYNYFSVERNGTAYTLSVSNPSELSDFFNNRISYSLEHFIIGEGGSLRVKTEKHDFTYQYPSAIKRYKNSLFNFIFIPETLNRSLSNGLLFEKVNQLQEQGGAVSCAYSRKYHCLLAREPHAFFTRYPTAGDLDEKETEEEARRLLEEYFSAVFPEEFLEFSMALVEKIRWDRANGT